jgi:hypothetical protein
MKKMDTQFQTPNKTKIDYPKEPNEAHKNNLKEEILQEITENFKEMLPDKINQNVQEALKKFQDNKNKEYEKTQKQINEFIGTLNKYQSETENTINREINELRMKIENIKEEVTMIWQTSEKRMKQIQNTMEGNSSRQEHAEGRISELEDEMEVKGKTEELLLKQLKPVKGKCKNLPTPSKDHT